MLCLHHEVSEVVNSERQPMGKIPVSGTEDGSRAWHIWCAIVHVRKIM